MYTELLVQTREVKTTEQHNMSMNTRKSMDIQIEIAYEGMEIDL